MARYARDYEGISAQQERPRGMDPNYREGGYRGMRMHAGEGQAPYGRYRLHHAGDYPAAGGFQGRSGHGYDRAYHAHGGYDHDLRHGGGVRDPRYDREYLRDFNRYSPAFWNDERPARPGHSRYDREMQRGPRYDEGERLREPRPGYGYGSRGLNRGGFSQPWLGASPRPRGPQTR